MFWNYVKYVAYNKELVRRMKSLQYLYVELIFQNRFNK